MVAITTTAFSKPVHTTAVKHYSKKSEPLPNSTITIMRRVALGIALVLWTVSAFASEQYNQKQIYGMKCKPFNSQMAGKSSLTTFGTCR